MIPDPPGQAVAAANLVSFAAHLYVGLAILANARRRPAGLSPAAMVIFASFALSGAAMHCLAAWWLPVARWVNIGREPAVVLAAVIAVTDLNYRRRAAR